MYKKKKKNRQERFVQRWVEALSDPRVTHELRSIWVSYWAQVLFPSYALIIYPLTNRSFYNLKFRFLIQIYNCVYCCSAMNRWGRNWGLDYQLNQACRVAVWKRINMKEMCESRVQYPWVKKYKNKWNIKIMLQLLLFWHVRVSPCEMLLLVL